MTPILQDFYEASENLCRAFNKKYYYYEEDGEYYPRDDDFYMIGDMKTMGIDTVWMWDQYWDLSEIQTALINDIDSDTLWKWYDLYKEPVNEWKEPFINLWHFHLKECNKPMYTKEEIEASEKWLKEAKKIFKDALSKYKK